MKDHDEDEEQLRTTTLENAKSILAARRRAEHESLRAQEVLEQRSAELTKALAMVRATLEATTDGILVTDNAGKVTDFNEKYVTMWSIPEELMNTRDHRLLRDFESKQLRNPRDFLARGDEIRASATPDSFDVMELTDGRVFELVSKLQRVGDRSAGRVWSLRDVTDRVRAEFERAYLSSIIASSTDAIISKTLGGIITSWNASAEKIFGYTSQEAIGQPMAIIIPAGRPDEERMILERLGRGESIQHFETVRVRKDGQLIGVSLTISPVRDSAGRIIGVSKIVRDITEREQLLSRERAARARAEDASRLKDEFLAVVSHELRNPLNAILGWAGVIRMGKIDEAKMQQGMEIIERNARTQARLIEDLLDVSRIIAGKLRLDIQAVMPADAVQGALDTVKLMAAAKGVEVSSVLDPLAGPVSGDPSRLQQIFWNLLSNAVRFTPKGGRVQVRLERINSHLEIAVADTGEGIDPEFLPHVFDRFRQADASSSRRMTGLGLGLAIVRQLVELHGGTVVADSPGKGRGATFTVRLPVRAVHSRQESKERVHPTVDLRGLTEPLRDAPSLEGLRILVVDDASDTRSLLREVLEQCGGEVREAGSAAQALDLLQEWRPAVIVSDIGMPGDDGYVLIRRVRELEKQTGVRIPAIALTAYARNEDRTRALRAGYQAHVAKPVDPMEFLLQIARAID